MSSMIYSYIKYILVLSGLLAFHSGVAQIVMANPINGMTFTLGKDGPRAGELEALRELNCNWVAFVPVIFAEGENFNLVQNQYTDWQGLTQDGLRSYIKYAKDLGFKVMVKPQIIIERQWPGIIDFDKDEDWALWESQYRRFIMDHIELANEEGVDLFCIGTELKASATKRKSFWTDLIGEARKLYLGKVCYSANWDNYDKIGFWSELDFIGISAYFPLSNEPKVTKAELLDSWKKNVSKLRRYSIKKGKAIIFTEYGYRSAEGAVHKHWLIDDKPNDFKFDEEIQYLAFDALLSVFYSEAFWKGGFIWKWYSDSFPNPDPDGKDYTPQNKKAKEIISLWYNNYLERSHENH